MGRIVTSVKAASFENLEKEIEITALVDTGAMYLTLPMQWKDRLGDFGDIRHQDCYLADGSCIKSLIAGPVRLKIEGFDNIYTDICFVDMKPDSSGHFEPLLGCIPLEQSQAAVDMLGHRLLKLKGVDLKGFQLTPSERSVLDAKSVQSKQATPFENNK
jgi:predicted aspartyl protease